MVEYLTDEEFYRTISNDLESIYSLSIPFERKRELYYYTYETMWRHLEGKAREKETEENFRKFGKGLDSLKNSIYEMRDYVKGIRTDGRMALINAQIAAAKMKNALESINSTRQRTEEVTKGLMCKIDAGNTLLNITLKMINQKDKD